MAIIRGPFHGRDRLPSPRNEVGLFVPAAEVFPAPSRTIARLFLKGKLAGIGRGVAEAEDLVQETILAIHLKLHTYDPAEPLTPWVYAVARYKLIDFLRRTRASSADVPIDEANNALAHDDNIDAESSYDLKRLMQRLPEKMRSPIEAVELEGQSIAEAADRCGLSESGVKVNIHRGLKALAALIARETQR